MSAVRTYSCSAVVRKFGDTIRNNDTIFAQVINKRREISVETAETKCTEATGGAIITGITNGVAPYSYSWSSGSVKDRADTLEAGFYKVTVTDSEGCTASQSFTIEETGAPKLTSNTIIKNNSCFGNPDGSIDITVIGGSIPYKYQWSNGMLTEDITLLPPGQYDVVITDNTSCRRFASFIVQEPPPLYLSVASVNSSANANNGIADVNVTGGTQPYKYLWPLTGETTSNISDLVPGIYSVIVTDKNGCTDSISATIFKLCGPDIIVNSVTPSECGLRNGSIDISIPGDNGPYEYLWSNGDTVQDLTCVPSGEYTMTVAFKDSACASVADITIPAVLDPVPICMVTVDTATEHNMIIWQEPYYPESLSAFNIYRETEGYEVFELIGTRLINEESFYIDTDRVANTAVKSWKYKLSVVDTCGNESELYGFHKTMHLEVNEGPGNTMILTWDNYSGFDYFTCHIYRYSPEEGLVKIFSKASTPELIFNTYTDLTPPDSGYNYFIEIESPYSCTSQKKATSHNSVRSNKAKQVSSTGIKSPGLPENLLNMGLYPNPNNGTFILILNFQNPEVLLIRIYDSNGRLVTERKTAVQLSRHEENFNLDGSGPGVYFIQVITNEGVVNKPFIIE
jgi:hypothetical protein